ncbi:MAG: S-layer homology domain-containing protein, partial [Oscillospiraceae bacterium]
EAVSEAVAFTAGPSIIPEKFVVTILSPTTEEVLKNNETFEIKATVTDANNVLKNVEFLINDKVVHTFLPSGDGVYKFSTKLEVGSYNITVKATSNSDEIVKKSILKKIDMPKMIYDKDTVATASLMGSDGSSTPNAVIDGFINSDTGAKKWYVNGEKANNAWLDIAFGNEKIVNKIILHSGYIARIPENITENDKPNGTAEIPMHFKFQYRNDEGNFVDIPGAVFNKKLTELKTADKVLTFEFGDIKTSSIKFVALDNNWAFRLLEVEMYGYEPNNAPKAILAPIDNDGILFETSRAKISVTVTDKENDVQKVELFVDGVLKEVTFEKTENVYMTRLEGAGLSKGKHKICVKAYDGYMAEGVSNEVEINVIGESDMIAILNNSTRATIETDFAFVTKQLQIDTSDFDKLTTAQKQKAYIKILEETFTNKADFQKKLDKIVADIKAETTPRPPQGGGSGGGSSGGGAPGGIIKPTASPKPTPTATPTPAPTFTDLDDVEWARTAIETLAKVGVVNGVGGGLYAPYENVTRGQFVKMIIGGLGRIDKTASVDFSDVSETDEFYPYIATAQSAGIVNGRENGTFGTDELIAREDMAVMLERATHAFGIKIQENVEKLTFDDEGEISDYALDSVAKIQMAGIMNGVGGNKFEPKRPADRAMAAKVVYEIRTYSQEGAR